MNASFPVQVTFHGVHRAAAIEELVQGHVAHLQRFHPRIHGCRVVITPAEGHAHAGGYQVQLRVAIPGNDVVVGHRQARAHADMAIAVGDAFDAAKRMLAETAARLDDRARAGGQPLEA